MLALVDDTAGERPLARAAQLLQLLPRRGRTHKQKQYLASMRSRKKAVTDALSKFTAAKTSQDATTMETVKVNLLKNGLHCPLAFHVIFFREKAKDLIRFGQLEGFTAHVSERTGYLSSVVSLSEL